MSKVISTKLKDLELLWLDAKVKEERTTKYKYLRSIIRKAMAEDLMKKYGG